MRALLTLTWKGVDSTKFFCTKNQRARVEDPDLGYKAVAAVGHVRHDLGALQDIIFISARRMDQN